MKRVLFVVGTRPEVIKLGPVITRMRREGSEFEARVCVTAQHREMLDQVLNVLEIAPDYDLNVMEPGQSLFESSSRILAGLSGVFQENFDLTVVQGDTTTTLCGALGSFYARVPVAHVEAGLRTGNLEHPFPEEMNRILVTRLAALHFAATESAAINLRNDGIQNEAIYVTGNPVIDAILQTTASIQSRKFEIPPWSWLAPNRKLVLVTAHRRENFGRPFANICRALATLSHRPDVQIAYAVHPNPNVRRVADEFLRNEPNIVLLPPLGYAPFVDLMSRSYLVLTDSGGIQEEAPSLGKPVLVLRETTERPEAVAAGVVRLVGTEEDNIVTSASTLLDDPAEYGRMARQVNPYGDGRASERIVTAIRQWFSGQ